MPESSTSSQSAVFRCSLACDLVEVRNAARLVHSFLAEQGCDEDFLMACELALVEGCNNAIQYAPDAAKSQPVQIEVICGDSAVELRITDHTNGFVWPKEIELPDPEAEHGRGLYLMQSLMDSAMYLPGDGRNILILRKNRPRVAVAVEELNVKTSFAHGAALPGTQRCTVIPGNLFEAKLLPAGAIQELPSPKELPPMPGFDLAMYCQSAESVGGDFCDVLVSGDSVLLVIADVMGKGFLPSTFAAAFRNTLRATPDLVSEPARLLGWANDVFFEDLSNADLFITAQVARLDAKMRTLTVASAGHCPLLLCRANGSVEVSEISPDGMPLGISPDTRFTPEMVELDNSSRVLLYTDGIPEALNAAGNRFGQKRLMHWLRTAAVAAVTADELKQDLLNLLVGFQAGSALNDDQAFIMLAAV